MFLTTKNEDCLIVLKPSIPNQESAYLSFQQALSSLLYYSKFNQCSIEIIRLTDSLPFRNVIFTIYRAVLFYNKLIIWKCILIFTRTSIKIVLSSITISHKSVELIRPTDQSFFKKSKLRGTTESKQDTLATLWFHEYPYVFPYSGRKCF